MQSAIWGRFTRHRRSGRGSAREHFRIIGDMALLAKSIFADCRVGAGGVTMEMGMRMAAAAHCACRRKG